MTHRNALQALAACVLAGAAAAQGNPIDLSSWTTVQYELNSQPDASWDLQAGNTAVLQSVNSDASIFLSDFDAAGQAIQGSWRVESNGDDDFMGFVFGYQGRGSYYLFDWKKASQNFAGFAEVGMTLKVVDVPNGMDPTANDLWPTAGSASVTPLMHNTIPWVTGVSYDFELIYTAGNIEIIVRDGTTVLEHWNVADTTFASGQFGFYNYSQDSVRYEGFTQTDVVTKYCTAKVNSQGCVPELAISGFASLTDATPCVVSATQLVNRMNGVLYLSQTGPATTPFLNGTLCLAPPLIETTLVQSGGSPSGFDCSGSVGFDVNAFLQGGGVPGLLAGDSLFAQFVVRDVPHVDGTGAGLTQAVELVVQP